MDPWSILNPHRSEGCVLWRVRDFFLFHTDSTVHRWLNIGFHQCCLLQRRKKLKLLYFLLSVEVKAFSLGKKRYSRCTHVFKNWTQLGYGSVPETPFWRSIGLFDLWCDVSGASWSSGAVHSENLGMGCCSSLTPSQEHSQDCVVYQFIVWPTSSQGRKRPFYVLSVVVNQVVTKHIFCALLQLKTWNELLNGEMNIVVDSTKGGVLVPNDLRTENSVMFEVDVQSSNYVREPGIYHSGWWVRRMYHTLIAGCKIFCLVDGANEAEKHKHMAYSSQQEAGSPHQSDKNFLSHIPSAVTGWNRKGLGDL